MSLKCWIYIYIYILCVQRSLAQSRYHVLHNIDSHDILSVLPKLLGFKTLWHIILHSASKISMASECHDLVAISLTFGDGSMSSSATKR